MKNKLKAIWIILTNEHYVLLTPGQMLSCVPRNRDHLDLMMTLVGMIQKNNVKKGRRNAKAKRQSSTKRS